MKKSLVMALCAATMFAVAVLAVPSQGVAGPSPKRGVGFNQIALADLAALKKGVSWAYNWGVGTPDVFRSPEAQGVAFIPMVWGPQQGFLDHLEAVLQTGPKPAAVLGLNEPNLRGQAFMSPEDAATAFAKLSDQCARHGVRLVAPNMAMGTPEADSWRGLDPLQGKEVVYTFMIPYLEAFDHYRSKQAASDKGSASARPAALGVHIYGNIWELKWIVDELGKRYPGVPIWVTEFNWSGAQSEADALDYMAQAVDALERAPNVERYAWFKADLGDDRHSLVAPGGGLTALGRLYASMPHPDPKRWDKWPGVVKAAGAARIGYGDGASVVYDKEAHVVVRVGAEDGTGCTGEFVLQVDVAQPGGAGTLVLSAARGRTVTVKVDGTGKSLRINPPEPGKWGFQDYAAPLRLSPGRHVLSFGADNGDARFDWVSWSLPK